MQPGNLLHIASLGPGWFDKCHVMLHACFQLLSDCIEVEKLFECDVDWDSDDRHRLAKSELLELHRWWKARIAVNEIAADGDDQYREDDLMLSRLIRHRWALWI